MNSPDAIVMPKLGLTMTEGAVASWRVSPGDKVKTGDVLFVVETEKVANEIVAEIDGEIELLLIAEGETAPVGAAIAKWKPRGAPARIVATPYARKRARLRGLAIGDVVGTGPNGRIKAVDVDRVSAPTVVEAQPPVEATAALNSPAAVVALEALSARQADAHFHVFAEPDITSLLTFRDQANAAGRAPRLAILHFVVAAVGRVLRDGGIVNLDTAEVGVEIEAGDNVFTAALPDADRRGLNAIAVALEAFASRAREGTLTADDMRGAAITILDVGTHGASHILPTIAPGQSAVLGAGAARPTFRPDASGAPKLVQELGLVLACDSRVWNGARAARFLRAIARFLEQPLLLLT